MSKNVGIFLVFIALILLSVLVVNGLYFNNPAALGTEVKKEEKIEESAKDRIKTTLSINEKKEYDPELAEVVLGFENESKEQSEAVSKNNQIVSQLMEILEAEELENIETQYFRVYPYTSYEKLDSENEDRKKVTYYKVSNQIRFTTKDLGELPVLLAELLNAGANRVVKVDYLLENKEQELEEVTAAALASLKKKAAFMAEHLDKDNYRIVKVNFGERNIYEANLMRTMARSSDGAKNSEVPLAEQKVNINVALTAEVELY